MNQLNRVSLRYGLFGFIFISVFFIFYVLFITDVTLLTDRFEFVIGKQGSVKCYQYSAQETNDIFITANKSCRLPRLNPWDRSLLGHLNPDKNTMAGCEVKYEKRSHLNATGHLWVAEPSNRTIEGEKCYYRCKHQIHDHEQFVANWTQIEISKSVVPGCDIMEVKCETDPKGNATYKFEHIQIVEKEPSKFKAKKGAYDIYIVVVDSMSASHFIRAMPMTSHYIQRKLDGVFFPYLNKVGGASRYNGYGILIGEQLEHTSYNFNHKFMEARAEQICKKSLNNITLYTDFRKAGYRTMHFEDSANTIFVYPRCTGFTENEIDHNCRPFTLPFNGPGKYKDKEMHDNVVKFQCKEHHTYVLETLSQFMGKYEGVPKFSLNWLVWLIHDEMDNAFHIDRQFRQWFEDNRKKIDNAFFFFQGDHGQKLDSIARSEIGKVEAHNPFLTVILPEKLRSNKELIEQLLKNSNKLVTQFDIHATLREIMEESEKWTTNTKFVDTPTYKYPNKTLFGSSLFHTLKEPRNCESLGLPFYHCMCEQPFKFVNDSKLLTRIAQMTVDQMNEALNESEEGNRCAQLTVDIGAVPKMLLQIFEKDTNGRQKIRAEMKVQPSGGLYAVYVEMKDNQINFMDNKFPRIDRYEEQSKCISPAFIKNYCYCKDLIKKKEKTS
ncbi:hypothetical protein M3Y97_01090100 [Aphelenchoides bicaudatus]|nr:hypothetical protein M3Y97_01090100 [Aphelenchoides bicaudatus]